MGEKVYKPIVKDGDHLIRSKDNPDRVRGLTRDENNQNPDIIEWEEYDVDDLRSDDYDPYPYEERRVQLTPEQEEFAQQVGEALGAAIVAGGILLFREVISPWWKDTAWPWVKEKGRGIKNAVSGKKEQKTTTTAKTAVKKQAEPDRQLADVSSQIDKAFEQFYFEMDEEEAKAHMMRLVYHMLGVVNEIRIISNARIRKDCESEELCIERQKEAEKFLSEKVAAGLDQLLSNENLRLDLNTSRELFSLTGGGVRLNGEYVPVQAIKIDEALKAIPMPDYKNEYGKKIDMMPLAETWECSVHPDGPSTVAFGTFKGMKFAEVLNIHPEYLGKKVQDGKFPILVKFIDAKQDLSVQVHPDDAYALEYEHQNGKTEMWYVIDAEEGANLIYGFRHKVTEQILKKAVKTDTLEKHLQKVEVHKGDVYYVPAGTVHGIGKGILLVEIQESSNVTYRVYDYNRVGKDGKKRELHIDRAVRVMDMNPAPDVKQAPRMVRYYPGGSRELLCRCKYFEVERIQVTKGFTFSVTDYSFQNLMCLDGYGQVETMDADLKPVRFVKGETMFLPAGIGRCLVIGDTVLLKIRC